MATTRKGEVEIYSNDISFVTEKKTIFRIT